MTFDDFFKKATGVREGPYPFQRKFAEDKKLYQLVNVPTGLGKTAMAVLGWLWRRREAPDEIKKTTPRRLVYCLPMRVLVEQTRDNAVLWLNNLGWLGGNAEFEERNGNNTLCSYAPDFREADKVTVHILMGGEKQSDWAMWPEREMILIGTQDMLLSRALNRGYAASRARWPMEFGLLNNDCLWVFDEIQLMGPGLATTTQLEAFRRLLGSQNDHGGGSVWMSATLQRDWLKTVDLRERVNGLQPLSLAEDDRQNRIVNQRWMAKKPLAQANAKMGDMTSLAKKILQAHKLGTRTIVVVNTVQRACELHDALTKASSQAHESAAKSRKKGPPAATESDQAGASKPRIVLLHSRFRLCDREARFAEARANPPDGGTIIVSTQVIEAGVDVSATTLFTELAPWASLVQRFGRCNRYGEANGKAAVYWIGLPKERANAGKLAAPYELSDSEAAASELAKLTDVGLSSLPNAAMHFEHTHVIRRRDLIDLFDTTPDLAGNDIDIDRFIRDVENTDVRVFWRTWDGAMDGKAPPADKEWRHVEREELCPAAIADFCAFASEHNKSIWRWDHLEGEWVRPEAIYPGQVYLVRAETKKGGRMTTPGYDPVYGWGNSREADAAGLGPHQANSCGDDAYDDDEWSHSNQWLTIAQHTDGVCHELDNILALLLLDDGKAAILRAAARWHDGGKAHAVFRRALPEGPPDAAQHWAKAPGPWRRYERRHFRHELASALAVLQRCHENLKQLDDEQLNLVAYLVAAHHGKVRLSIRSMPNELHPRDVNGTLIDRCRFARGVWDGDVLPQTDLGGEIIAPEVTLSLEPMELGLCEEEPFKDQPSWAERMIRLRDRFGPFRLAYLEALLRAADWRASQSENHP